MAWYGELAPRHSCHAPPPPPAGDKPLASRSRGSTALHFLIPPSTKSVYDSAGFAGGGSRAWKLIREDISAWHSGRLRGNDVTSGVRWRNRRDHLSGSLSRLGVRDMLSQQSVIPAVAGTPRYEKTELWFCTVNSHGGFCHAPPPPQRGASPSHSRSLRPIPTFFRGPLRFQMPVRQELRTRL